jgi:hypothetical protein
MEEHKKSINLNDILNIDNLSNVKIRFNLSATKIKQPIFLVYS